MKPKWTGQAIAKMHINEIRMEDVANEMGVGKPYISMILNGLRNPPNAKDRIDGAIESILSKRKEESCQTG